ncbi:sugar kinase [Natronospirillum operosum]|nr:sugar kinase [Natronospirillum operosum]
MKVLSVLGECMVELTYQNGQLVSGVAGDTYNTAVYFRRLCDHGWSTRFVSAVGHDPMSDRMLQQWQQEGLDSTWTQRLPDHLPGIYMIDTDRAGERSFYYWRDQSAAKYWLASPQSEAVLAQLQQSTVIYLSGISLAILPPESRSLLVDCLRAFREDGGQVAFDGNYRRRLWENRGTARYWYSKLLRETDLVFLTLEDEQDLWDDASVDSVLASGRLPADTEVVIKQGADPAIVQTVDERLVVPACRVEPNAIVDTTAAGDSFSAGYLAARLQGLSARASAQAGNRLAARVIQHPGAILPRGEMPALVD